MNSIFEEVNFKDSKVGKIPVDWHCMRLDKISDINPKPIKCESDDIQVSFIGMADVSESAKLVNSVDVPYGEVKKGFTSFCDDDVLVAKITPCFENGKGALVSKLMNGIGFGSTEFHVIRAKQGIGCPEFIHQITTTHNFRVKGEMNMTGTAGQKRVGKGFVESYLIAMPPFAEQQKIAEVLSTVDQKIDLIDQKIVETQKLKTGLMQKLFSEGVGVQEENGEWQPHASFKDSPLGTTIPSIWKVKQQQKVATFYNGRAYKRTEWEESGTPVIRLQNLTGTGDKYYYSNMQLPEHQYVNKGELLFMWSATFGPKVWSGDKAIYHYHIWKVVCDESLLSKSYMFYSLLYMTEKMKKQTNGSTMLHFTKKGMEEQLMVIPPISEQNQIAEILGTVDQKLNSLKLQKLETEQLKKGLMQKLLTGEWRVPLDNQ